MGCGASSAKPAEDSPPARAAAAKTRLEEIKNPKSGAPAASAVTRSSSVAPQDTGDACEDSGKASKDIGGACKESGGARSSGAALRLLRNIRPLVLLNRAPNVRLRASAARGAQHTHT